MSQKIIVPTLGESVTEATVAKWLKAQGEKVNSDEPIVELETDKVNVEVPSPTNGVLETISVKEGQTVNVGSLLGTISSSKVSPNKDTSQEVKSYKPPIKNEKKVENKIEKKVEPLVLDSVPDNKNKNEEPLILEQALETKEKKLNLPTHEKKNISKNQGYWGSIYKLFSNNKSFNQSIWFFLYSIFYFDPPFISIS